jgi:hypothetical protein
LINRWDDAREETEGDAADSWEIADSNSALNSFLDEIVGTSTSRCRFPLRICFTSSGFPFMNKE